MAKVSVSIDDDDLRWIKEQARRRHGGNVSAVVAEGTRLLRHHEALGALLDALGAPKLSAAEIAEIGSELDGTPSPQRRRGRRVA